MKTQPNVLVAQEHTTVRIHRFLPVTEVEGPGRRACLWAQGCVRRCPGCCNPDTWTRTSGTRHTVDEVKRWIDHAPEIEGVTFVGGEPFLQARAIANIGEHCQSRGLSVVTYTGYGYRELKEANRADWNALLAVTDLLLAGPYVAAQQDFSRPWVGSTNQEYVFLSERYRRSEEILGSIPNELEVHVEKSGQIAVNGLAGEIVFEALRQQFAELGLKLAQS